MHDRVIFHVVERNEDLNGEPSDEPLRDTLKVVHLDKLIQIHGQHLKAQDEVLAEHQRFNDAHNVLLIIRVVDFEFLQDSSLDEALLVEALFVAQDLQGDDLLFLVIPALEDLAEAALTDALLHLEAVGDVVVRVADVLALVVVKAAVLRPIRSGGGFVCILAFQDIKVVDGIILEDLSFFVV